MASVGVWCRGEHKGKGTPSGQRPPSTSPPPPASALPAPTVAPVRRQTGRGTPRGVRVRIAAGTACGVRGGGRAACRSQPPRAPPPRSAPPAPRSTSAPAIPHAPTRTLCVRL
eukprot:2028646-Rhodomonas_salina.1